MGRTNPTYRDAIRRLEQRWGDYRRALRPADRERFDRLLDDAREHADAGGNLNAKDPVVPVLLSMVLARERRIDALRDRVEDLEGECEDLRAEAAALREDVAVLRDDVGALREDVDPLRDRVDDLQDRVEDLQGRVDDLDGGGGGPGGRSAAGIRSLFEFLDDEAV